MHTQHLFTGAVASGDEAGAEPSVERGASVRGRGRPDAADTRDCPAATPGTATRSESGRGGPARHTARHARRSRRLGRAPFILGAVIGVPLIATPSMADAQEAPTVVALWHMDEARSSSTMFDSSGFHHDGSLGSNVTPGIASDDGSTGYNFQQPSGMVRVPHDPMLNPGDRPITISAHLRVAADLPVGDYNVLEKGTATASGGAYKLEVHATRRDSPKFGFPDCAFNGAAGQNRVYGPKSIADGQWHTVVCHLTATQAYVTIDGRSGKAVTRQVTTIANTVDLTVGAKPDGKHGYVGDADEVSISIG